MSHCGPCEPISASPLVGVGVDDLAWADRKFNGGTGTKPTAPWRPLLGQGPDSPTSDGIGTAVPLRRRHGAGADDDDDRCDNNGDDQGSGSRSSREPGRSVRKNSRHPAAQTRSGRFSCPVPGWELNVAPLFQSASEDPDRGTCGSRCESGQVEALTGTSRASGLPFQTIGKSLNQEDVWHCTM